MRGTLVVSNCCNLIGYVQKRHQMLLTWFVFVVHLVFQYFWDFSLISHFRRNTGSGGWCWRSLPLEPVSWQMNSDYKEEVSISHGIAGSEYVHVTCESWSVHVKVTFDRWRVHVNVTCDYRKCVCASHMEQNYWVKYRYISKQSPLLWVKRWIIHYLKLS